MGRLRTKSVECQCKQYIRLLTEHFIDWLNDDGMINEILTEVASLGDTEDTISEYVLLWAHRSDAQMFQK